MADLEQVILIVLFEVNEDQGDVVATVVVGAALVSNLLRDVDKVAAFSAFLRYVFGQLFLSVYEQEPVGAKEEDVVIVLNIRVITLRIGYYDVLVRHVPNSSTHGDLAINARNTIATIDETIGIYYASLLVGPVRILVHGNLSYFPVLFQ